MKMIGRWNNKNRNEAIAIGTTLSTKYEDLMREKMKESHGMTVTPSTEYLYTVFDCGKRHAVNMRERICTCRRFHMDVMPFPVYPIPDESIWEIPLDVIADIVLPPKGKIRPGRPQKILTQKSGESRRKKSRITCGLCGQQDHNRQTYRNIPQEA
uniref:Uncharacterized protein n=1 Tax=Solanum lycopersicum TaxID=4081 RepID=A0A3Q7GI73_SOLLC